MYNRQVKEQLPLYVDLDGTLVKTDIAREQLVKTLGQPKLWRGVWAACRSGRAGLKSFLATHQDIDATTQAQMERLLGLRAVAVIPNVHVKRERMLNRAIWMTGSVVLIFAAIAIFAVISGS